MIRVKFFWRDDDCLDDLEIVAELSILPPVGDLYEDDDGRLFRIRRRVWTAGPSADADVICELDAES